MNITFITFIIFGILFLFIGIFFVFYNKNKQNNSFNKNFRESTTVWEFTIKNFPFVVITLGLVFILTGISSIL